MSGLNMGEVVRRPPRLGSRSRSGITMCHQAPKENRARHMHVWQEGRSHLGLYRRPGDRKKVRYQVHRSSSCLRMWLLWREGLLILRTGVALWLFSGPLNPEPNLTGTESLLSLPDKLVPEQHLRHLHVLRLLTPHPVSYMAWWVFLPVCLYHLPLLPILTATNITLA